MECLKLITSDHYTEKRIGYLGISMIFHEKSEVLMMATNRIRIDLQGSNQFIVALALQVLSEVGTSDMCKQLEAEVRKLMTSGNIYIKKKAALAGIRIVRKSPDMAKTLAESIPHLLKERNHGVFLSALGLMEEILKVDPSIKAQFKQHLNIMTKVQKNLVGSYSAEFDTSGIFDPFLQVKILKFFKIMGEANEEISEELIDPLAQVATNITANKNAGNAVLYECVRAIMTIESSSSLRSFGISILGKFLANKDNNSRYVSLQSLKKVVQHDIAAVRKHKDMILDCLKEYDISIKKRALDLLFLITSKENIKSIVKELLNILLVTEDDLMFDLSQKICLSIEGHAPSRRWHIDSMIKVLTLAGNYVTDEAVATLIHLISATPKLWTYSMCKIFFSFREHITQRGLAKLALWSIGEFGELLTEGKAVGPDGNTITVSAHEVMELIDRLLA